MQPKSGSRPNRRALGAAAPQVLLATALGLLALSLPGSSSHVETTDLGTLGGQVSYAWSVNAWSVVVGYSETASGDYRAFRWDEATGMTEMATLGGTSVANEINEFGISAGASADAGGVTHAVTWDADGNATDLGTLGGTDALAYGINGGGDVAVTRLLADGTWEAVLRRSDGSIVSLGTLGGRHGFALDVNDREEVVGYCQTASGQWSAFYWAAGTMTQLGDLGGGYSFAAEINDDGTGIIGGGIHGASGHYHTIVWRDDSASGSFSTIDLGTAWGGHTSSYGINNSIELVGSGESSGRHGAFVGDESGDRVALPGLGGTYDDAEDVNDFGDIAGWSIAPGGEARAILWDAATSTSVPCNTQQCDETCSEPCQVDCSESHDCNVGCDPDISCAVDCTYAHKCDVECGSDASCDVACAETHDCKVDCGSDASCDVACTYAHKCDVECAAGATCNIRCDETHDCKGDCVDGAICDVDCAQVHKCDFDCLGAGTDCSFDCSGVDKCDDIKCKDGASCLLECGQAETCKFKDCGGTVTSCPGNVLVCNRPCP